MYHKYQMHLLMKISQLKNLMIFVIEMIKMKYYTNLLRYCIVNEISILYRIITIGGKGAISNINYYYHYYYYCYCYYYYQQEGRCQRQNVGANLPCMVLASRVSGCPFNPSGHPNFFVRNFLKCQSQAYN